MNLKTLRLMIFLLIVLNFFVLSYFSSTNKLQTALISSLTLTIIDILLIAY
ncbi:MAG: hypothetical protein ACRCWG_12490 [Sarcina sp.]